MVLKEVILRLFSKIVGAFIVRLSVTLVLSEKANFCRLEFSDLFRRKRMWIRVNFGRNEDS